MHLFYDTINFFAAKPPYESVTIDIHDLSQDNAEMEFVLRMSKDWEKNADAPVRILFMSPYRHTDKNVELFLDNREWSDFADKNRLALITAKVGKLKTNINDRKTCYYYPENYSGSAFLRAIGRWQKKFPLSGQGMLIYGVSAGAQWDHRLALWNPDMALGVFCHVSSFYDLPHSGGLKMIWLISTGYLDENSLKESTEFFQKAKKLELPLIFKIYPTIGHQAYPAADQLARAFFQTLLDPPISGDGGKAIECFITPATWGHVRSNKLCSPEERAKYQDDGWFCPLLTLALATKWLSN